MKISNFVDANAKCCQISFGKSGEKKKQRNKKSIWLLNKVKIWWKAFKTKSLTWPEFFEIVLVYPFLYQLIAL